MSKTIILNLYDSPKLHYIQILKLTS